MKEQETRRVLNPQLSPHTKDARSEGNAIVVTRNPTPFTTAPSKPSACIFGRSESSPSVASFRIPVRRSSTPSPDILSHYYAEDEESCSPTRRGRQRAYDTNYHRRQVPQANISRSPSRQPCQSYAQDSVSRPTSHQTFKGCNHDFFSGSSSHHARQDYQKQGFLCPSTDNRNDTRSPNKSLRNVTERDETEVKSVPLVPSPSPSSTPPKRRSRSPMKKMFGEHGWLGNSPDSKEDQKLQSKKSANLAKKRPTMIGKIKHKWEEFVSVICLIPG